MQQYKHPIIRTALSCYGLFLFFFLQLNSNKGYSQPVTPLNRPYSISGSFGEIRSNHFHSGIDLRTGGKKGLEVAAIDSGMVSRIKVGPNGYGKALYITHPNGTTSVYAHLQSFNPRIAQYVEDAQYSQKRFAVNLFPKPNELPVKRGDIVGYSGNSGSSGGPHLHFEIRETSTQRIVNPLTIFPEWALHDHMAPYVKGIYLYRFTSEGYLTDSLPQFRIPLKRTGNTYSAEKTVEIDGTVALGIEAYDRVNKRSLRCGITRIRITCNSKPFFSFAIDTFGFFETRFVNSIIDYSQRIKSRKKIIKTLIDPNNRFSGIEPFSHRGLITPKPDSIYRVNIAISDFSGNTTTVLLTLKGVPPSASSVSTPPKGRLIRWNQNTTIAGNGYSILIPKGALYHNIQFNHSLASLPGKTPLFRIHSNRTPLHKPFTLTVDTRTFGVSLPEKAYLAYQNEKNESLQYIPTRYANRKLSAQCRTFGKYTIAIDTIPPKIVPQNISDSTNIGTQHNIRVLLFDNTGIADYQGTIDGNWVLFEWDPKSNTLLHKLRKQRTRKGTWHTLQLKVTDYLKNTSQYSATFFW